VVGSILLPQERAGFFGFMRFSYYIITGGTFAVLGVLMGAAPPRIFLQFIIGVIGVLILGRSFFVSRIKLPEHVRQHYDLRQAFSISVHNSPLVGFSVNSCFMMLAFAPVLPLTLTYLQNTLHLGAHWIQLLSCAGIAGNVCGFFFYGKMVKKMGIRNLEILIHIAFIIIPLALMFCRGSLAGVEPIIGTLLFLGNFVYACFLCAFSQEILALARPGNATMASAFANTYMQIGIAVGRSTASFLLGCGALTATWQMWGLEFTDFQTLFMVCAALALFGLILIFSLPSVIPKHDDYYAP
jgi:Na+/melibiose symporter-like transporter